MSRNDGSGKLNQFFDPTAGKVAAGAVVLIAIIVISVIARPRDVAADLSRHRKFICSETNKAFDVTVEEGMMTPVKSPYSGKNTGYPAEMCWWTKDGQPLKEPHYVLLKKSVD